MYILAVILSFELSCCYVFMFGHFIANIFLCFYVLDILLLLWFYILDILLLLCFYVLDILLAMLSGKHYPFNKVYNTFLLRVACKGSNNLPYFKDILHYFTSQFLKNSYALWCLHDKFHSCSTHHPPHLPLLQTKW